MKNSKSVFSVIFVVMFAVAFLFVGPADAKVFKFKMQSTWPAGDFHNVDPQIVVDYIHAMSGGRIKIDFMPAGTVVAAFEVLDAVHRGILDLGHSWPGYWVGKHPASGLFSSASGGPFGLSSEDFLAWMYEGGGLDLYNELLQKELKLNVIAFPTFGETPEPQGWFNKPLKSWADLKGLKFRAAGMTAEVFKEAGATVVTLPGGEIVPALEKGVIDAAEYSDPSSDKAVGLHDVRKFYHLPGLHQPTGMMELLINKKKWDELPNDLKEIVRVACEAATMRFTFKMLTHNAEDLKDLVKNHGVTVVKTPPDILIEVLKAADKVLARKAKENAFFSKVLESQRAFAKTVVPYRQIGHPDYDLAADYYYKK